VHIVFCPITGQTLLEIMNWHLMLNQKRSRLEPFLLVWGGQEVGPEVQNFHVTVRIFL